MRSRVVQGVLAAFLTAITLPASAATENQVFDLGSMLSGTFEGSSPGNELRVTIRSVVTDPSHPYDLFVSVTGRHQGNNVRQQGLLRLESQGRSVYVGYVPHFDPTVTALSANVARFTEEEGNAACGFNVNRKGDGFAGEVPASACMRALRGATGKWSVEIEPGSIRLQEVKTGETLRFKRVSKS